MRAEILYEDEHILVAYKPAGLATQTARVGRQDLVGELKNALGRRAASPGESHGRREPYLGVIHRLDQPVEGLLVFAKNKKAAASLSRQLQGEGCALHKRYYAALYGWPSRPEGELVHFLRKEGDRAVVLGSSMGEGCGEAKRAALHYQVLRTEDVRGRKLALADIRLHTGRFHQIRAQMAHVGMPLLGDLKYGDEALREASAELGIRNVALCAYSLEFAHPVSGEALRFRTAPRGAAFSLFPSFPGFSFRGTSG